MKKALGLLSSPMVEFSREQFIPRPREVVFAFFERPENLARLTPPSLGFRLLTPSPVPMKTGSIIDYSIRPFGWPLRWTSVISEYEPPHLLYLRCYACTHLWTVPKPAQSNRTERKGK